MIGLFISEKIRRDFPYRYKLKILARPGTLQQEDDSNRQINDKGNQETLQREKRLIPPREKGAAASLPGNSRKLTRSI